MSGPDIGALMEKATIALGGSPDFTLVLLNEASASPRGSLTPQKIREGSVVLMDCGCAVHGYVSDISRTWVIGQANARQRKVWNTVKRGQELALETAKIDIPVGAVDDAVRKYYQSEHWAPASKFPALSHPPPPALALDRPQPP